MTNATTTQPTTERYCTRYIDRIGAYNKRFFDVGTGETVEDRAAKLATFWGAEIIIELGPMTVTR